MASLDPLPFRLRLWLLSGLCVMGGTVPGVCAADHVTPQHVKLQANTNPVSIRLPIVQSTDDRFVRISTAQGVSQIKADQIVQDDQGFMWFGTRYGLYRYDGYNFRVFAHDPENPNSLGGIAVGALFKDRDGSLWVACDQSLNKFNRTTESFEKYPIPSVRQITQDSRGTLWFASRGGLYNMDPESRKVRHYSSDPKDPWSLESNAITYCGEDREGAFWIAGEGFLDEFDRKEGKVIRHILLPARYGFGFYEDRLGVFWIFHGAPDALATFDRKSNTLTNYVFPAGERRLMRLTTMLEDKSGTLWLATLGLGLLKFDREHGRFVQYANVPTDPESLPQDKLDSMFADREGNIWVAPGRMAPALLTAKPLAFQRLPKVPGSTIEPFVGALYQDLQGILWMGGPEALVRVDRKTGRTTAYKAGGPEVGTDVVSICEDRSSNLWIGTYGHGLHVFDRRTGKFKTYRHNPDDPNSLNNDYVLGLLVDRNGTLWAATGDGLDRFDSRRNSFVSYKHDSQSQTLAEDQEGNLWVGTESSGLLQFNPATGRFVVYEHDSNLPNTLSDNHVNSLHFDRSQILWVGTQNGLDKFDPQTGRFIAFTQRDGLPGNAVGCVLEDNSGDLWMSTNNGVARFTRERLTFSTFSTEDGLPGPNLTGRGACFQSPTGEMFFGGFNGGVSFFPANVVHSSYVPPIVLTDFRLSGNSVAIGGHSPLRKSISSASDLTLEHQQNVISIAFAALSYANSATNRYRYTLDGLETGWNEVGSDRRQVTYTTLPAGMYTFRAQGATRDGPWSDPGVALHIEVLPPWWSTRPIQYAVGTLLCLFAWAAYRQRMHQVARQFEARVEERTRIARELHDTLLQSFQGAVFQFQAARRLFLRNADNVTQVMDEAIQSAEEGITEGRAAIHDLRPEPVAQRSLAELLNAAGRELAGTQGLNAHPPSFRVTVEGKEHSLKLLIQDEVYRIAREVIRNAFHHAAASLIEVEIRYDKDRLRVRIRDDGKGIDRKVLEGGGPSGHWGIPGMRERAQGIGSQLEFWSEAGAGTEAELMVPAAMAYERLRHGHRFRLFPRADSDERRS